MFANVLTTNQTLL